MHQPATALISHPTGRLRRRATVAHEQAASAVEAVNWLSALAGQVSDSAALSLMFVDGEPVVVDTSDYALRSGTEAVVVHHDGRLAVEPVDHDPDWSGERHGYGPWRGNSRAGVTILGRVIGRATPRMIA